MLVDFSQLQKFFGSFSSIFTQLPSILVDSSQFWVNLIQFCSFWVDLWSFFYWSVGFRRFLLISAHFDSFCRFWSILISFLVNFEIFDDIIVLLFQSWFVDFGYFFTDLSSIFCIYLSIVNISPFWLVFSNLRPI